MGPFRDSDPTCPGRRAGEDGAVREEAVVRERRVVLAYGACAVTLVSVTAWVVLALARLDDTGLAPYIKVRGPEVLAVVGFVLLGTFLTAHRSRSGLGPLMIAAGASSTVSATARLWASDAGVGGGIGQALAAASTVCIALFIFALYLFPLYLPDGSLPRHWLLRPYAVVLAVWSLVQSYGEYVTLGADYGLPGPLDDDGWTRLRTLPAAHVPAVYPMSLFLLINVTVMTVRWRHSPGRRQVVALLAYLVWLGDVYVIRSDVLRGGWWYVTYVGAAAWLIAAAYAFSRDRSAHLDRATRRVLSAFVLGTALIVGCTAVVLLLSRTLPGGLSGGALVMGAAGLVTGGLLYPTARWAVRCVDRFYYGERARPYHVVRALAERLSQAVGPGEAPRLLCDAVVAGLRMPGAKVRVETRGGSRVLAAAGEPGPGSTGFPLVYEGGVVGSLDVTPRPGDGVPDRQDREVLRFLADQMAPAIASLRLYEDLRAAREQMVVAREDARRRLRRNLHDGLGPALSGVRLQVDTARYAVPDGSAAATSLATASEGIGAAISELRRIADGLTPAALDRLGLSKALRELADRLAGRLRVGVEFTPDPLPPLPAAVEVAVYLIGGEALNNVVRHSGAATATVTVRVVPDRVTVEVSDDGQGLPDHRTGGGVGLRSIRERAAELGGHFRIANGARGGAVLHASFPPVAGPFPDRTDSG